MLVFYSNALSEDTNPTRIVDSLVNAACLCLEKAEYQCAKDSYVNAYQKGMSRDSLAFFIAALYVKKENFDTALVYNLSCTTSISVIFPAILDQRTSILTALFPKEQSDSSLKKQRSNTQMDQQKGSIGFSLFASYSKYKSNKFPFIQEFDKQHDALALESGNSFLSVFYDYLMNNRSRNYEPHFKLNLGSIMPLDSTFFSSYSTKNITAASEIFILNKKNMHAFLNRLSLQYNFKTVVYSEQIFFDAPVIQEKFYYMPRITGKLTFENNWKITDANIGGSLYLTPLVKSNFQRAFGILLSYIWKENEYYFNYIQGNTDSVIDGKPRTFYFDQDCTTAFTGLNYGSGYWPNLIAKPIVIMPGQTVDVSPVFNSIVSIFKFLQIESSFSVKGRYFIDKVQTLTLKNKDISFLYLSDKGNVLVLFYNKQSDNFYYLKDQTNISQGMLSDENIVHFERKSVVMRQYFCRLDYDILLSDLVK